MITFENRVGPDLGPSAPAYPTNGVPAWYRDAKFGIFVHWGIYSVPGWATADGTSAIEEAYAEHQYAEWYANTVRVPGSSAGRRHEQLYGTGTTYEDLADRWSAPAFDPREWIRIFREAGAQYVVPTTKHHDGFCLWDTATTGFSSARRGPRRDVVAEIASAVRDAGLRLGLYYSGALDWHAGDFPAITSDVELFRHRRNDDEFARYCAVQLRELIARFSPDVLWNDLEWPDAGKAAGPDSLSTLLAEYFEAVPDGVVNDRWGVPYHGYLTREYLQVDEVLDRPWEACRGIGRSFGYNSNEPAKHRLSGTELVRLLVDVVAKNGNLLLNVGPRPDGTIPAEQLAPLAELGAWLATHGEAIWATRPWSEAPPPRGDLRHTADEHAVYVHTLDPASGSLTVPRQLAGAELRWLDGPATSAAADGTVAVPEALRGHAVAVLRAGR
ncbi:alpha-L-fucosidase [Kribbella sp. NPDC059898]|uniref:alpha-L-fucosidase n=1 Tax=Kribbella sp. NPDC059898 TaxID=3346995 RepID=UPI003652C1AD